MCKISFHSTHLVLQRSTILVELVILRPPIAIFQFQVSRLAKEFSIFIPLLDNFLFQ